MILAPAFVRVLCDRVRIAHSILYMYNYTRGGLQPFPERARARPAFWCVLCFYSNVFDVRALLLLRFAMATATAHQHRPLR